MPVSYPNGTIPRSNSLSASIPHHPILKSRPIVPWDQLRSVVVAACLSLRPLLAKKLGPSLAWVSGLLPIGDVMKFQQEGHDPLGFGQCLLKSARFFLLVPKAL